MELFNTKDIVSYWFNNVDDTGMNTFWFDTSSDLYITERYQSLVDKITYENYNDLIKNDLDKIALLIVGDQFTRNIYRNTEEEHKNDKWVLELATSILRDRLDFTFPLNYRFFILLPLRHAKRSDLLDQVVCRLKLYCNEYNNPPNTLVKFYNHTIKNYTYLTDTIVYNQNVNPNVNWSDSFLCVLEQYKPVTIMSSTNSITQFKEERVAVSLSGGVDSMVLMSLLKKAGKYVVAIHIEYCNREEAVIERQFLQYYCNKNNIPLYYRTINYVTREDKWIDRNIFETETKKCRFHLYRYVIEKEKLDGVCLGHHMGDIVENVFTNMLKGHHSDLVMMKPRQELMGVNLFRPFLKVMKDDIFNMAHYENIPYFLNTTPTWSCRGVLRNTIIPALKSQFGDFENNIVRFAEQYEMKVNFYEEEKQNNINIIEYKYMSKFETNEFDMMDKVIMNFMHKNGYPMASNKSMKHFIEWCKGNKQHMIQLNKHVFCFYEKPFIHLINYTRIKKEQLTLDSIKEIIGNHTMILKRFL